MNTQPDTSVLETIIALKRKLTDVKLEAMVEPEPTVSADDIDTIAAEVAAVVQNRQRARDNSARAQRRISPSSSRS